MSSAEDVMLELEYRTMLSITVANVGREVGKFRNYIVLVLMRPDIRLTTLITSNIVCESIMSI